MNKQIDMNDTPETNNERTLKLSLEVFTELAKTLKQERDDARGEQCSIQCAFEESQDKIEKLERERDEWAAMCGRYKQERDIAEADATNFHARIFELINERDEARSKLVKVENERDHWKKIASAFEVLMPPVGGKRILKIIERDGWKCAYCGVETCFNGWDGPMPTVDHITPKAKGGLDHIANCVVACKDCNSAKSDQENWSPNSGEQKEKKTWAWEDGKFRKKTEK
jgi:hypothetical protein